MCGGEEKEYVDRSAAADAPSSKREINKVNLGKVLKLTTHCLYHCTGAVNYWDRQGRGTKQHFATRTGWLRKGTAGDHTREVAHTGAAHAEDRG